jgi:hypothetical protein
MAGATLHVIPSGFPKQVVIIILPEKLVVPGSAVNAITAPFAVEDIISILS